VIPKIILLEIFINCSKIKKHLSRNNKINFLEKKKKKINYLKKKKNKIKIQEKKINKIKLF
jgi:hypothetical protein